MNKDIIFFFYLILSFLLNVDAQTQFKPLSKKEKVDDFICLFEILKETYPYFEVNKRMHNIDWLSNKKYYIKTVEASKTDSEYYNKIVDILNDLNNGHTDTYPTLIYSYFYNAYKQYEKTNPDLKPYVLELEKSSKARALYWKQIAEHSYNVTDDSLENTSTAVVTPDNIEIQYNTAQSLAYIKIRSFSYDVIENDKERLKTFFTNAHKYENLIIDIQGNEGGDDTYWMELIVPYLISEIISYPVVYAFKNSDRIKLFKQHYKNNITYSEIKLPNLPEELKSGNYAFLSLHNTVEPNNLGKAYKGNFYLLIDDKVFSSSDTFAYFCKVTNLATLIGEKTEGDGIGTDPLLLTLPNSGIVIRFTGEMALNPDGSSNEEYKTIPHYTIKELQKDGVALKFKRIKLRLNKE